MHFLSGLCPPYRPPPPPRPCSEKSWIPSKSRSSSTHSPSSSTPPPKAWYESGSAQRRSGRDAWSRSPGFLSSPSQAPIRWLGRQTPQSPPLANTGSNARRRKVIIGLGFKIQGPEQSRGETFPLMSNILFWKVLSQGGSRVPRGTRLPPCRHSERWDDGGNEGSIFPALESVFAQTPKQAQVISMLTVLIVFVVTKKK